MRHDTVKEEVCVRVYVCGVMWCRVCVSAVYVVPAAGMMTTIKGGGAVLAVEWAILYNICYHMSVRELI